MHLPSVRILLVAIICKSMCRPNVDKVGASARTVSRSGSVNHFTTSRAFALVSPPEFGMGFHVRIHLIDIIRLTGMPALLAIEKTLLAIH